MRLVRGQILIFVHYLLLQAFVDRRALDVLEVLVRSFTFLGGA